MKVYYRFSFRIMPDNTGKPRNPPSRPPWFDKWRALENFVNVFKEHDITLVADGVDEPVWEKLNTLYSTLDLRRTEYKSNAGSFLYSLDDAIALPLNTIVYFVEDDYIHHEGADIILEEGVEICPYISLYDHPDKYWGDNVNVKSFITMTENCHWRTVPSTTMTFATRVKYLIQDRDIFQKWCGGDDNWTHDAHLFTELSNLRGLITPVPGYASHMETWVIAKLVDWEDVLNRTSSV